MTTGQTLEDVEAWPERIAKVTLDEVKQAAVKYFDIRRSVTGQLLLPVPEATSPAKKDAAQDGKPTDGKAKADKS